MSFPFDTTVPAAGHDPSVDRPVMQTNNLSTSNLIAVDHVTFGSANSGKHNRVTFNSNNVPAGFPVTPPVLFTDTVAGLAQLKFYSGDAAHSSNQYVASGNGSTFLLGGIILKWGVGNWVGNNATVTVSFAVAFPNGTFGVVVTPIGGTSPITEFNISTPAGSSSSFTVNRANTSISGQGLSYIAIGF